MPERRCETCKRQTEWGCYAKSFRVVGRDGKPATQWVRKAAYPLELAGEETWACPRQHIRENEHYWSRILLYYGMYKKGHLPQRGAVSDQSNKAIEIFRIMDDANFECDQEQIRSAKEKAARDEAREPLMRRNLRRTD